MAGAVPPVARRLVASACLLPAALVGLFGASHASAAEDPGIEVAPGVYASDGESLGPTGKRGEGGPKPDDGRQPRIVGGSAIDISQAPWQTAVVASPAFFEGNAQDRQFCGGSLVAQNLVITAAHCVFNEDGTALQFAADELSVITGRTVLTSNQGQELPVQQIHVFLDGAGAPLYNPDNNAWDIAVLQLGQPSTTGGLIKIPGPDETELWSFGRAVFVSGWGHTRFGGEGSDQLLMAELMMVDNPRCIAVVGRQGFDGETSICAGVLGGGRDSCQGDSGGPLVAPTAQGDFRLVGDVQAGVGCANAQSPGIYGRFGVDPVQTALRNVGLQFGGIDIVGSGGTPPLGITINQGLELTRAHAEDLCDSKDKCRSSSAGKCRQVGSGVQCRAQNFNVSRRGKKTVCNENILWTGDSGVITGDRQGKRVCKRRR